MLRGAWHEKAVLAENARWDYYIKKKLFQLNMLGGAGKKKLFSLKMLVREDGKEKLFKNLKKSPNILSKAVRFS